MNSRFPPVVMIKKFLLLSILFGTAILASCTFGGGQATTNPEPNHSHADFAVYIDGERFNFAQQKYMSEAPRKNESGEEVLTEVPGRTYLHLHDMNGNVVHRHKPQLTLGDFFRSIGFTLSDICLTTDTDASYCDGDGNTWRMFVNGEERALDPGFVWNDLDKILLTFGPGDADIRGQLQSLTDDACRYSKTCPERGAPPAENCIADPTVPCLAPNE